MADYSHRRALLISSSRVYGRGYLDHAEPVIREFLASGSRVLFLPYALYDRDAYAQVACGRFESMGYPAESIHRLPDPRNAVLEAEAIFVGGGNTFRLLKAIYDLGLFEPLQRRVREGMAYIGSSAGSNLACPTIRTTNDMPIVEPPSLNALGFIGFQINPHYLDPDSQSRHMGETREQRLREYLEENDTPVVGLREPSSLLAKGPSIALKGAASARLFRRGQDPMEIPPGAAFEDSLSF